MILESCLKEESIQEIGIIVQSKKQVSLAAEIDIVEERINNKNWGEQLEQENEERTVT